MNYRHLTPEETAQLERQLCHSQDWDKVMVSEVFSPDYVFSSRFSGDIRLGSFRKEFLLAGGMKKHAGLYHVTLHNVEVGDDCCIESVNNYIANYRIGHDTFIENVDTVICDGDTSFGNGVEVSVLNETGGREVTIYDRLSAQQAYVMALYRHRPELIGRMRGLIGDYIASVTSSVGTIGPDSVIVDTGYIKNVNIGERCKIEGASRLKNGSINSTVSAPVHIGVGVIGDDFIISSGASVEDGVTFSRCFIGQACKLGHNYSASDSLFFSNCQGENGEACAIFAGPFTVTHHKSSLLIAGMFSFMNAGSGSNQSNHMYKLGPIHQGIMERGAKTASDSYLLWPAKVGAFSLVMGRHVSHQDTSDLPFSYLIEDGGVTFVMPGANLKSVGTIRDAKKWPTRDARKDPDKLDCINFNLLSPYTVQKMLRAVDILKDLRRVSGSSTETYSYQNGKIRRSSLEKGLVYYGMAIDKFLGNSLISRIQQAGEINGIEGLRAALRKDSDKGSGDWVDLSGLIAPRSEVFSLLDDIESGAVDSVKEIDDRFHDMHSHYYSYEWDWAHDVIESWYGIDLASASVETLIHIVHRWRDAVVKLDNLIYEDARKEFSLSAMTSFGADGDEKQRNLDFFQVRGASFENDPFVKSVADHIVAKGNLAKDILSLLDSI
jgi:NDP-sugar pyrophosphorylase family protein